MEGDPSVRVAARRGGGGGGRSKPVEALKTALEGTPLKTRDERCKVWDLVSAMDSLKRR